MKYGIGQLVRVKYFKDLEKEHEVDSEGNITIDGCIFLREMKVYCGELYKVQQIFGNEYELLLKDGNSKLYFFHKDMLELPNKAENDTTSHENTEVVQEQPKRQYVRKKVE